MAKVLVNALIGQVPIPDFTCTVARLNQAVVCRSQCTRIFHLTPLTATLYRKVQTFADCSHRALILKLYVALSPLRNREVLGVYPATPIWKQDVLLDALGMGD